MNTSHIECIRCGNVWLPSLTDMGRCPDCGHWNRKPSPEYEPEPEEEVEEDE